jgi:hypothetical protein
MRILGAALLATAAFAFARQSAVAQDVVVYSHPNRPKDSASVRTVRAILLGYDKNETASRIAPYVIVRLPNSDELARVYLTDNTKIDGVRFFCPINPGLTTGYGVCPRLPSDLALKLPVTVNISVWPDSLEFSKAIIMGTDTINVVPQPAR